MVTLNNNNLQLVVFTSQNYQTFLAKSLPSRRTDRIHVCLVIQQHPHYPGDGELVASRQATLSLAGFSRNFFDSSKTFLKTLFPHTLRSSSILGFKNIYLHA